MANKKITAEVKHMLRGVWYYDNLIRKNEEAIAKLRSRAEKMTTSYSQTMISGGESDRMAESVARLVDLQRDIDEYVVKTRLERQKILFYIGLLDDYQERIILEFRYVHCMKWLDIALDLNYDVRTIYRIHGRALINMAKVVTKCH